MVCRLVSGRYVLGVLYGENRPKSENWATLTHRSSAIVRLREKLINLGNSLAPALQRGVNSFSLQCITWPVAYSEWGACLPILDIRFWGQITHKVIKFSKMSFRIPRRDTEIRFLTKFGVNRPLRSCRKVVWFTTEKNSRFAGLVPAPILPKMGRSRPKFPERCHPLICPCIPNLVRIGCVLPDLFQKDWFFRPKKSFASLRAYACDESRGAWIFYVW